MKDTKLIERRGVTRVQDIVYSKLNWIFREQLSEDYGIDAQIEIKENRYAKGKVIGVQIKTGDSYFNKKGNIGKVIFKEKHYEYWKNYSLPVIIIFVNLKTNICYWEFFNVQTVNRNSKGDYYILSNENQVFDERAKKDLLEIANGTYMSLPSKYVISLYDLLLDDNNFINHNYTVLELEKIMEVMKLYSPFHMQINLFQVLKKATRNDYSKMNFSYLDLYGVSLKNIKLYFGNSQAKFNHTKIYVHNFIDEYPKYRIVSLNYDLNDNLEVWLENGEVKTWDVKSFQCIGFRKEKSCLSTKKTRVSISNDESECYVTDSLCRNEIVIKNKKESQKIVVLEEIDVGGVDFCNAIFENDYLKMILFENGAFVDKVELFKNFYYYN